MENKYEEARDLSRKGTPIFLWEDLNGELHYGSRLPKTDFVLVAKFIDGIDVMDGM